MIVSIINQYGDKLKSKYADKLLPSHFKVLNDIKSCRTPEAGEFLYIVLNVAILNVNRYHVGTETVQYVKIMKQVNGLIVNKKNYYLSFIIWLLLLYLVN